MKTAISIPTPVFRRAEQVAKRLKLSRSELYRRALESFMAAQAERDVTRSYDEAFAGDEPTVESRARKAAAKRVLRAIEWSE